MKPGTLHKLTREGRRLAGKDGPKVIAKVMANAVAGDANAARLYLNFLHPKSRMIDEPVPDATPPTSVADACERIAAIAVRQEKGEIDFDEAEALVSTLRAYVEAKKTSELELEVEELRATVARLVATRQGE
jgi:hypothetical protein